MMTLPPPAWAGRWDRRLLAVPGLPDDTSSTVTWLQAHRLFGDLRQPVGRPSFEGCQSLADCSEGQLAWLAGQQAFVGHLEVYGELYRWNRELEYGVPPPGIDAGVMRDVDGLWHETGVFADYLEHWAFHPWQGGPCQARKFMVAGDGRPWREGQLCVVDNCWMLTIDGEVPAYRRHEVPLLQRLDGEFSLGRLEGGIAFIEQSTLPWREGLTLQVESGDLLALLQRHPAIVGRELRWNEVPSA